ncbi:uncharacterized protein METZ01_LOCUS484553, partial [marine metagenome]
ADMNAKDEDGLAPLHYSARADHKEIVELLINNGADVNVRSTANLTPLDLSSGGVADLIRKQGGKTSKELIALSKAARTGNIAEVKKHLAAGADVNAKDMYGDTPLHDAVKRGHREVVELLITNGADMNMQDGNGRTPLYPATALDHREIVAILIAKGADVNVKDDDGSTPLHKAAGLGRKEIVELLIAEDADLNAKTYSSQTPLDRAVLWAKDKPEIAVFLRKHGGKTGEELKAEGK